MNIDIEQNDFVNKFKSYKSASIFIYTIIDENIHVLLFKKKSDSNFTHMQTEVLKKDNTSTFAIARLMTEFFGLFSIKNIERIKKGDIRENDLDYEKVEWFNLWHDETFRDWLEIMSSKELIQYDGFEDSITYFIDLHIKDTIILNKVCEIFGIEFIFVGNDNILNEEKNELIDKNTITLLKLTNFEDLIKDTLKAFVEDNVTYFYTLSNKEPSASRVDQVGFFHFPCLLQGLYKRNKEIWILYSTGTLIFPSHEKLLKTKAIIVPGSHLHVNEDYSFLRKTEEWLRKFHKEYPKIKFLGICFGLQQICVAMGGEVEPMRYRKHNKISFISGPEKLTVKNEFWDLNFVKNSGVKKHKDMSIYQSHGDEVVSYPSFLKLMSSSRDCEVEILVSEDERYFCLQGHPEYDVEFSAARWLNRSSKGHYCTAKEMNEAYENNVRSKHKVPDYQNEWRAICYSFLKN